MYILNAIHVSQIDLLIVRKDQAINLCEMKYSETNFTVTDKVIMPINNKIYDLKLVTKTKYVIYPTFITTFRNSQLFIYTILDYFR